MEGSYVKFVNKTSRRKVGRHTPLCYTAAGMWLKGWHFKYLADRIEDLAPKDRVNILDFGCGKDAVHGHALADTIHREWAREDMGSAYPFREFTMSYYDIGANAMAEGAGRLMHKDYYDLVILSNVLNVQPTVGHLQSTLGLAWWNVKPEGLLICNYPAKPRHSSLTNNQLFKLFQRLPSLWDYVTVFNYCYALRKKYP